MLRYNCVLSAHNHVQINLDCSVTLAWWQVLLDLCLCWHWLQAALLSWLSGGGRHALIVMSTLMLLLYKCTLNFPYMELRKQSVNST